MDYVAKLADLQGDTLCLLPVTLQWRNADCSMIAKEHHENVYVVFADIPAISGAYMTLQSWRP